MPEPDTPPTGGRPLAARRVGLIVVAMGCLAFLLCMLCVTGAGIASLLLSRDLPVPIATAEVRAMATTDITPIASPGPTPTADASFNAGSKPHANRPASLPPAPLLAWPLQVRQEPVPRPAWDSR